MKRISNPLTAMRFVKCSSGLAGLLGLVGLVGMSALVGGVSGCQDQKKPTDEHASFALDVRAETYGDSRAQYHVVVTDVAGAVVYDESGETGGDFKLEPFACTTAGNPYRVEVTFESLSAGDSELPGDAWVNPAPPQAPIVRTVNCEAAASVPVAVTVSIAQRVDQGTNFKGALSVEDFVCTAELDCVDEAGDPLTTLTDPATGQEGQTVALAFRCSSSLGEVWLHARDVHVSCEEGAAYLIDPARGPGLSGPARPVLFQTQTARTTETVSAGNSCGWGVDLGLTVGDHAKGCSVTFDASASRTSWGASGDTIPEGAVWPVFSWSVPLTNSHGALACAQHKLGPASGITMAYASSDTAAFPHEWKCGAEAAEPTPRVSCEGQVDQAVSVSDLGDGALTVAFGGAVSSAYRLPEGVRFAKAADGTVASGPPSGVCCANPCCSE